MEQSSISGRVTATRLTLVGLSLIMVMPSLATSTANAALPSIARTFAASFQAAQWVVISYLLTITALVVAVGRLGDVLGRRRLLLVGTTIFAAGSLLCGVAPRLELLIAARMVQGTGAAIMMALTMAFVGTVVPPERTGSAMGLLGTMSAVGTTLGPALGGLLIAWAGSRAIFLVNVPIAAIALVIAWNTLPKDPPREATAPLRFDFAGLSLLAVALTAYSLAMTLGRGEFSQLKISILATAIVASIAFVAVEFRQPSPLVRLALLRNQALAGGLSANMIVSTVMMATLIVGPFYLTKVLGLNPASTGLILSVGPLAAATAGIPAGRLVDRFGTARAALSGLTALAAGAVALSVVPSSFGVAGYVMPIITMTTGYGLFQAANSSQMMAGASAAERGVVSGLLALSRNLGLVTGASAMGTVFAWGTSAHDVVTASSGAIAAGMHSTFMVAALLIGLSFLISASAAPGEMRGTLITR
jgi:EmrB/QacA subfamily drug resistance transporter